MYIKPELQVYFKNGKKEYDEIKSILATAILEDIKTNGNYYPEDILEDYDIMDNDTTEELIKIIEDVNTQFEAHREEILKKVTDFVDDFLKEYIPSLNRP